MENFEVLSKKYRLVEKIGEGGFSLVYKATNKKTGSEVAVKIIKEKKLAEKE